MWISIEGNEWNKHNISRSILQPIKLNPEDREEEAGTVRVSSVAKFG